jgi:hypothetical protein
MIRTRARSQPNPSTTESPTLAWRRRFAGSLARAALATYLAAGMFGAALARPVIPSAPPEPAAPTAAPAAPGEPAQGSREAMRDLTPAQRQAIRQLSREQREAINGGARARPGAPAAPAAPGARLTPNERRQLRAQIREEHERNGKGRFGSGKRP